MEKGTVINRLIGWSRRKLFTGCGLGFPKSSSFLHLVVDNSRDRTYDYTDVERWCIETNDAVEALPAEYNLVIRLEYLSNVRETKLKLELLGGISRATYYRRLDTAYNMIGNSIERKSCNTETIML